VSRPNSRLWIIGFAAALAALAAPAGARQLAGVELPDTLRVDQARFELNGAALYKKFGVRVLVAGLWLEHVDREPAKILRDDAPRRYVSHFLHSVSAKRICKAWREGLAANTPNATPEVKRQFQDLCSWIRDFHSGDEITVTYLPTRGSLVEVNGARVGLIPGKPFSDAYFALALGPKPGPGESFKKDLLGG
jgi:Chalcone isomerase-like